MRITYLVVFIFVGMGLQACGSSEEGGLNPGPDSEVLVDADISSEVHGDIATEVQGNATLKEDGESTDSSVDSQGETQEDILGDLGSPACVGAGCPGESCRSDLDCDSLHCVLHLGDKKCSLICKTDDDCPDMWVCDLQANATEKICRSKVPHLCLPCIDDGECVSNSGTDFCVPYPEQGSFCGGHCVADSDCPDGYSCAEKESVNGVISSQCVNDAGVCECTPLAVNLARLTPCERLSTAGTCEGVRKCTPFGLTKCRADDAVYEECNGQDDDCDGAMDEETCDDQDPCTVDQCSPEFLCVYEETQALVGLCGDEPIDPDPGPVDPPDFGLEANLGCVGTESENEIAIAPDAKVFSLGGVKVTALIPEGITKVDFKLWGAGGGGCFPGSGGGGAFLSGAVPVTPGKTVEVWVGSGGVAYGAGGGASYIRVDDEVVAVAGGGGGAGCDGCSGCVGAPGTDGAGGPVEHPEIRRPMEPDCRNTILPSWAVVVANNPKGDRPGPSWMLPHIQVALRMVLKGNSTREPMDIWVPVVRSCPMVARKIVEDRLVLPTVAVGVVAQAITVEAAVRANIPT